MKGVEHLDVVVVGAGLSGIAAGYHLQTTCPWASYAILEARDCIGGTWDLFRYPGIRSDSDMYTLGYPFRPWRGEKAIAEGDKILQYIKDTASEFGIDRHIRFQQRVVRANWSSEEARWHLRVEVTDPNNKGGSQEIALTCSFLFSCSGYYRYDQGYTPEFKGIEEFAGELIHPQEWPENLDYANKEIVVVGSGATAVTLIPSLARDASHVTMLQRSPTYIASLPPKSPAARLFEKLFPPRWSGSAIRWFHALFTQAFYFFCKRWPEAAKRWLRKGVEAQLPEGFDIDTHFTPKYDPWDQRLCVAPQGDFFRAIKSGKASVVTESIDCFTEKGIQLESGKELHADIIITATGLELLFAGGITLSVDGEPVDLPSKLTYKGMMLEGVPNFAMALGYTNASWTLKCDLTCDYVARLLNTMRKHKRAQCVPINHSNAESPEPLLGLSSGYFVRSAHRFPKQGSKAPWRVHNSYLHDYQALKRQAIIDHSLELSHPTE